MVYFGSMQLHKTKNKTCTKKDFRSITRAKLELEINVRRSELAMRDSNTTIIISSDLKKKANKLLCQLSTLFVKLRHPYMCILF